MADQLTELFDQAIDREIVSQAFYIAGKKMAEDPGARQLLAELAEEEGKHQKMLEELPDPTTLPDRSKPIMDLKISDYLVDLKFNSEMQYQDVMILAMKNEEKSLKFYRAWEEKTQDQGLKKLFAFLADEEAKHKYRLESIYDEKILD
jgi:rubrerythrin